MRVSVNVFNFNNQEESFCNSDCPTEIEVPGHKARHEAIFALMHDASLETYLWNKCPGDCTVIHGVLAATYLASVGLDDEDFFDYLGLPWLGERP